MPIDVNGLIPTILRRQTSSSLSAQQRSGKINGAAEQLGAHTTEPLKADKGQVSSSGCMQNASRPESIDACMSTKNAKAEETSGMLRQRILKQFDVVVKNVDQIKRLTKDKKAKAEFELSSDQVMCLVAGEEYSQAGTIFEVGLENDFLAIMDNVKGEDIIYQIEEDSDDSFEVTAFVRDKGETKQILTKNYADGTLVATTFYQDRKETYEFRGGKLYKHTVAKLDNSCIKTTTYCLESGQPRSHRFEEDLPNTDKKQVTTYLYSEDDSDNQQVKGIRIETVKKGSAVKDNVNLVAHYDSSGELSRAFIDIRECPYSIGKYYARVGESQYRYYENIYGGIDGIKFDSDGAITPGKGTKIDREYDFSINNSGNLRPDKYIENYHQDYCGICTRKIQYEFLSESTIEKLKEESISLQRQKDLDDAVRRADELISELGISIVVPE